MRVSISLLSVLLFEVEVKIHGFILQFLEELRGCGFLMSGNNSEQKEKPLAGISLKMIYAFSGHLYMDGQTPHSILMLSFLSVTVSVDLI